MPETTHPADTEWLTDQVGKFEDALPHYELFADLLGQALHEAAGRLAPLAIVQTRPKSIASFAEKALRKRGKYHDPVHELTDLCGARVIARTRSEVEALCDFVKTHFEIDWDNSIDAAERLQPTEFGYRSIHYIVSFKPGSDLGLSIPEEVYGLKAEIQVRTTTEHAWSDFAHDLSYKGAFELPVKWQRELAVVAAELEEVDHTFTRIEEELAAYAATYGAYLSEDELRAEIATLEIVLGYDSDNAQLASRIGKLAITLGDWAKAISVLSPHVDPKHLDLAYEPLLRDLGIALCKQHRQRPAGRDYRRGQRYLERATRLVPDDSDALASLAGTWKGLDEERVRDLYRQAFDADPSDFYPLGNFLEYEIRHTGSTSILAPLRPVVEAAIERCRAQAEVGINLPWVYYGMAKLHLLLGEPYESLRAYAKAVEASTAAFMIEGSLESLEMLSVIRDELVGHEWARRLLLAGLAARFPSSETATQVEALASRECPPIEGQVVIVVGATDPGIEKRIQGYGDLMLDAFQDFCGTIISGGTEQGVSGLVGLVSEAYPERVRSLGYVPEGDLPDDATLDTRYSEIRRTDGKGFSPLEPLQNWIDLLAAGIDPRDVTVLGISGGAIAAIEYRIALALGASVGVVEATGREAARLLADEQWAVAETLVPLPPDPQTVRAFVGSGAPRLSPHDRETIARTINEAHRQEAAAAELPPWESLSEAFRESCRQQADHILQKLRQIGCTVERVTDRRIALMEFTDAEIEIMAEMEHGRWNAERLSSGWRPGEHRDVAQKTSPHIVGWADLPEEIREWDRSTVRRIPAYLAEIGLEVRREPTRA